MGILSKLSGASAIKKGGKKALAELKDKPFSVDSALGNATITEQGITTSGGAGTSLVPGFEGAAQNALGNAAAAPTGAFTALDPNQAFQQAGTGQAGQLGGEFLGAGGDFLKSLQGFNADEFAATQKGRLDSLAKPGEDRAADSLANRLFSKGRLGGDDTASGVAFGELSQAQARSDTERSLASLGLARDELTSRLTGAQGLSQMGGQLQGMDIQNFLAQLTAGTQVGGFQQQFRGSELNNALGATGGISSALNPTQMSIQNAFAGKGLAMEGQQTRAAAITGTANAAGAAKGSLTGGLVAGAASAIPFSDLRLKSNIKKVGTKKGYTQYSWDWNEEGNALGLYGTTTGVMADEVLATRPEAVGMEQGYYTVNYEMLGL